MLITDVNNNDTAMECYANLDPDSFVAMLLYEREDVFRVFIDLNPFYNSPEGNYEMTDYEIVGDEITDYEIQRTSKQPSEYDYINLGFQILYERLSG